ncbi:hypothetical protein J0871_17050 [Salegentibacter sp. BDJ18]|uniref:hypothetical protein n=1 Tax=Salegentibacter sp. BDJ18 TaxID=2816376 RepID=UPI001AAF86AA|nr:hypothetical protein [Salegentibacter sp. BDJ18]MBO2546127.1 hypothetical protein [Salegentibacter sp. BDJ18]
MAYDTFSTAKVFSNELVNILSNKLIYRINNEFAANKLVPYNDLAAILAGDPVTALPVVSLATPDTAVYNWLVKNLKDIINVQTQLSFQNRIQVVTAQAFFEIWLDAAVTPTAIAGPYNIPLADPQVFTESLENDLFYQNWKSEVEPPIILYYMVGDPAPASIEIPVQIENHFATEDPGKYSSFKAYVNLLAWLGDYENLNLSGSDLATAGGLLLTENNLEQTVTLGYQNLSLVDPGNYNGIIEFRVDGVRTDSGLTDTKISSLRLFVELRVIGQDQLMVSADSLKFAHVKNQLPLPPREFDILTTANFEITIPEYFEITGDGNIVYDGETWDGKKNYLGTGTQTIKIALLEEFDFYELSVLNDQLRIKNLDYTGFMIFPLFVPLTAYLFEQHGFQITPNALEYFAIKGVQNSSAIDTVVVSTESYVITAPYWIELSASAGEYYQELSIKPINVNNLVAGFYQDVILFTSDNAVFELPVMLRVVESIDVGFATDRLNFTNDEEEVTNIYSNQSTERASIALEITRFDYSNFAKTISNTFKGAFFENKMSLHLGNIIGRAFYTPQSLFEIIPEALENYQVFPYYRPANVTINLSKEIRKTSFTREEKNFENVSFLKGRTPQKYQANFGILNYDSQPVRVTKTSKAIFNFVKQFGSQQILVMRNNITHKTINHTPGSNSVFGLAIFFSEFAPGDVIEVRLPINENDYFSQQYLMFPDNKASHQVFFLSEYNTVECLEFTGAMRLGSKFEAISNTTFKDLVETVQNLEVKKELSLTINTGHLLKVSAGMVEQILRSKRVWLEKEGREISLTPVVKDFLNEDSEQAAYSYDVEFVINRKNDLQVYNGSV